uniref:ATP synthase complex subunit 8 n=1 Tax=Testudo graeca TaxID=86975 RepID=Q2QG15_TESGR|nr:ATP synthase F0 subunit 8 [Testudo graeca]AAY62398.1 ATP synthase F0 subunit 8 [Testudo graeca]
MPQLNPDPWFLVLTSTWLTYTIILQPKILSYLPTNSPNQDNKNNKTINTKPWTWPWT